MNIHTRTYWQYLQYVENYGMHLCCLNNSMNELVVYLLSQQVPLCYATLKMGEWKTIFPLHSEPGRAGVQLREPWHLTVHQDQPHWELCCTYSQSSRNSVNTSTAAAVSQEKLRVKEQTCHFWQPKKISTEMFIFCQKGDKETFPAARIWQVLQRGGGGVRELFIKSPAQHC